MKLCLLLLVSCGGGWSAADEKNTADVTNIAVQLEIICGRGPDDAGTCSPASVRALERASYCATASMLTRHGGTPTDAGIRCQK